MNREVFLFNIQLQALLHLSLQLAPFDRLPSTSSGRRRAEQDKPRVRLDKRSRGMAWVESKGRKLRALVKGGGLSEHLWFFYLMFSGANNYPLWNSDSQVIHHLAKNCALTEGLVKSINLHQS